MEKITKHQAIVLDLLKAFENDNQDGQTYILTDTVHHHYQVMRAGWDSRNHYFLRVRVHLHIKSDGKIWIMENRTEEDIAEMLVERGVQKKDIVLALLPEHVREFSGYAVA
jgi:glutathionylspermidine synthase